MKNNHPINPTMHGIIDYLYAGVLLVAPKIFGFEGAEKELAEKTGKTVALANTYTDHPVALKRQLSFEDHRTADLLNLATIATGVLSFGMLAKPKPRAFYLTMLALGLTNVLLTDWKAEETEDAVIEIDRSVSTNKY